MHKVPEKGQKLSEYMANNIMYHQTALKVAIETQYSTDSYKIQYLENDPDNLEETQFAINSYVLVKYENRDGIRPHAPPSKLHQNLVTNKLEDFHVTNLQPFHWDGNTNPLEVALSDDQSFLVEDILNHRFVGNSTIPNQMEGSQ